MRDWGTVLGVLLLMSSCDSGSPATSHDLSAQLTDLSSQAAGDLKNSLGCNGFVNCLGNCGDASCKGGCVAKTTKPGLDLAYDLLARCQMSYCNAHSDAGTLCTAADMDYANEPNVFEGNFSVVSQSCLNCLENLSVGLSSICASQTTACMADPP